MTVETTKQESVSGIWDMFTALGNLYVQDRQNERNNPSAYNMYAYQALAGADNSRLQSPYASPVGVVSNNQQPQQAGAFTVEQIVLGGALLLAAYMLLK